MLTLRQIVDMADKRVPNAETDATKVEFINELQKTLYGMFRIPQEIEKLTTTAGVSFYTLPDYVKPGRILNVVLTDSTGKNPQEYTYKRPDEELTYYNYTTFQTPDEAMLILYLKPSETGRLIMITFEESPNELSSSDMTAKPRFFPDYHMLFVYGLAAELARIQQQPDLANNWQRNYDELLRQALKEVNYPEPGGTPNVLPWRGRQTKRRTVEVIVQSG